MATIISITGPDGAGKSTLIRRLQARIEGAVAVSIWDLLLHPDTRGLLPFQSPQEVDRYLEHLDPTGRAYFLFHCYHMALVLAERHGAEVVLADSYWYKYFATEMAHGGDSATIRSLTRPFPEPDLCLFLDVEFRETADRKSFFSGYECGFADDRGPETFHTFQAKAYRALQELMAEIGPRVIDARQSEDEVETAALAAIRDNLPELKVRDTDPILAQIDRHPARTIAILGIDGSGKSSVARNLAALAEKQKRNFAVMTCPEYHHTDGVPHRELSVALHELNRLADAHGDFGMKGLALFAQMTLFGPVQADLLARLDPECLVTERHALIDTLVYGSFYQKQIGGQNGSGNSKKRGSLLEYLQAERPDLLGQVQSWMQQENVRVGRETGLADLPLVLREIFGMAPVDLLQELRRQFRTNLPEVAVLIDVDPQVAVQRLGARGGTQELHEQAAVLEQLRKTYRKVFGLLKQLDLGTEVVVIDAAAHADVEGLAEELLGLVSGK